MLSTSKPTLIVHLIAYSLLGVIIGGLLLERGKLRSINPEHSGEIPSSEESVSLGVDSAPRRQTIPHVVQDLLDTSHHFEEHLEMIRNLPTDLTRSELDALFELLEEGVPAGVKPNVWSTLQNELMIALRQPRFEVADYHSRLIDLVQDRAGDPLIRDYAAQHLVLHLQQSDLSQETRSETIQALLAVLDGERELKQQVTGTTLMAFCDLHQTQPELLAPHLTAVSEAVSVLLDLEQPVSLSNRISAIQTAGRFRFTELLPSIQEMARSEVVNANFRLSSIAALGYYQEPADQEFLQTLVETDSVFRHAAEAALLKYNL